MTDENLCLTFSALLSGQATMLRVMCKKELDDKETNDVWRFAEEIEKAAIVLKGISEKNDDSKSTGK